MAASSVNSVADLERVLARGVPCIINLRGAESVRAARRMVEMLGLAAGESSSEDSDSSSEDSDSSGKGTASMKGTAGVKSTTGMKGTAGVKPTAAGVVKPTAGGSSIGAGGDGWVVVRSAVLLSVARLGDHLLELTEDIVPAIALNPADANPIRRMNNVGKRIRKIGISLCDIGLSEPMGAGRLAKTLGNKTHKMTKLTFKERGNGRPERSAEDRGRYASGRYDNLLDQAKEILDRTRVRFV